MTGCQDSPIWCFLFVVVLCFVTNASCTNRTHKGDKRNLKGQLPATSRKNLNQFEFVRQPPGTKYTVSATSFLRENGWITQRHLSCGDPVEPSCVPTFRVTKGSLMFITSHCETETLWLPHFQGSCLLPFTENWVASLRQCLANGISERHRVIRIPVGHLNRNLREKRSTSKEIGSVLDLISNTTKNTDLVTLFRRLISVLQV